MLGIGIEFTQFTKTWKSMSYLPHARIADNRQCHQQKQYSCHFTPRIFLYEKF